MQKPLSNHVQSLRKLDISAVFEGLWCVGEHNLSLISQCINLKHLVVTVISSQVDPAPPVGSSSSSAGLDVIRRIIDVVAISIPQLDTLDIKPAALELYKPYGYTCRKIIERITTYQAPPSCRRLPPLSVGLRQFLECQEFILDDGRLRYEPFWIWPVTRTRLPSLWAILFPNLTAANAEGDGVVVDQRT